MKLNVLLLALAIAAGSLACQRHVRTARPADTAAGDRVPMPDPSTIRIQKIPGIGPLGGWNPRATDAEIAAIAGEHVTLAELAAIRQQDREGWWLLAVYSLAVIVGFVGLVAAFYFRQAVFLALPAAGLGVAFLAYMFLHAFAWLAWIVIGCLGLLALAAVWYVVRRGGDMAESATDLVNGVDKIRQVLGQDAWKGRIAPILEATQKPATRALVNRVQKAGRA